MSMEKTLQELADFLHGTLENEDPALRITGVNGLVEAGPRKQGLQRFHLPYRRTWSSAIKAGPVL